MTKHIQKKPYYLRRDYIDTFINLAKKHEDQKRRATDLIWSKNTYRLDPIVQNPGNRVLDYFQEGHDRAFLREQLMHVSEDTQVHPDCVSEWK